MVSNATDEKYHESVEYQLQNYKATQNFMFENYIQSTTNESEPSTPDGKNTKRDVNPAYWELHTTGYGRKLMESMEYSGGGLGKNENGIISPIKVTKADGRNTIGYQKDVPYLSRGLENLVKVIVTPDEVPMRRVKNKIHLWPENTTLITGSSIISGIEESRLLKYKAKVRVFPGAYIDDMYDNLQPLLKRRPANIILHIGSNDSTTKTSDEIILEIENLKQYIKKRLPNVNLFLSCPVVRFDNTKANSTLRQVDQKLKSMRNIIMNDNVDKSCVGKRGLHLNARGSGRLATNYISLMRRL